MDDYILEVLQVQNEPFVRKSAEKIKEILAWEAAGEEIMGQENGDIDEPEIETSVITEIMDVEETKSEVLNRILEKMAYVETGTDLIPQQEPETGWQSENHAVDAVVSSAGVRGQRQSGMGPEALSMFFQRDARRYS